ncbi:MAG: hypothetical protein OXH20_05215 [bacterium]|nr:hypothetical protein [bacterium]
MVPWQIAFGCTLVTAGLALWWAWDGLDWLAPFWGIIWAQHGQRIALEGAAATATVFTGAYWLASRAGLASLGAKLEAADQALQRGRGYDRELGEMLEAERRGESRP